ncbi:MAG: hypothetical protein GXX79_02745 [Actinomycetales bacterium]|nr:hypothetical protein [Actinomycetales bacterium]
MDWLPLASTGLGAVIALSGSLLATSRTGHDQLDRERKTYRRQTYIEFATALDAAHAALRTMIREPAAPQDRRVRARAAVGDSGLFRVRGDCCIGR